MISFLQGYNGWAFLIIRLVVGAIFLAHGRPKIQDLKQNAQNFEMMGFKPGRFWGTIVALVEFFGGLLLILGWFTQLAAALLTVSIFVAFLWKVKNGQKLLGGYEFDLLLFASSLILATNGGGYYALDNYWPITLY